MTSAGAHTAAAMMKIVNSKQLMTGTRTVAHSSNEWETEVGDYGNHSSR